MRGPARLAVLLAVVLSGCGTGTRLLLHRAGPSTHGVSAGALHVIVGWSDALRAGHVETAARYFQIPSVFFSGDGPPVELRSLAQVEAINSALPCGAKLLSAHVLGRYVNALFRLTNRSGPGGEQGCGAGTGQTARTDFLIRGGRIVAWLRAPDEPGDNGTPANPTAPEPVPPAQPGPQQPPGALV